MHAGWQQLCKNVGHIVIHSDLAQLHVAVRDVLSHLQIASIDMSRELTGAPFLGQLDSAEVVDLHGRRTRLLSFRFRVQASEINHLGGSVGCGHNLSFGRRQ
eukprot:512654-Pleurochrysis_carterae.AAC.1